MADAASVGVCENDSIVFRKETEVTKIKVWVGSLIIGNGGAVEDTRMPVEFEGEEVAHLGSFGDHRGGISDTRGRNETLYTTDDGKLIAHVEQWSHWQGEPNIERLQEIKQTDLEPGGEFEQLGVKAKMSRSMTVDEALGRGQK